MVDEPTNAHEDVVVVPEEVTPEPPKRRTPVRPGRVPVAPHIPESRQQEHIRRAGGN